jgi:signal transduction histidine kinase
MTLALRNTADGDATGSVVHDLNNLLNIIVGVTEALAAELDSDPANRTLALTGLRAAERSADLVHRLLNGPRWDALDPRAVDCAQVIGNMAPLVRQVIAKSVTLSTSTPAQTLVCRADASELEAVLLNLSLNAREAMPDGGRLTLKVERVDLEGRAARCLRLPPGAYAAFSVRDTGVGMPPAILRRAAEPHFTTRRGSGGQGLGLASAKAFARHSGGALSIASRVAKGTTVSLYLPCT